MSGVLFATPSLRKMTCALVDAGIVSGSLLLALALRFATKAHPITGYEGLYPRLTVLTLVMLLCIYYNGLYDEVAPQNRLELLRRVGSSFVTAGFFLTLLYYAFPYLELGRGLLLIQFPVSVATLLAWRAIYYRALRHDSLVDNVLILGTGPAAQDIALAMLQRKNEGYRIMGFLGEDASLVGQVLINPSVIGTLHDLPDMISKNRVDSVIVALEDRRGKLPLADLLECRLNGVRVDEASSFYETLTGQLPVRNLRPSWLIFSPGFSKSRPLLNAKRVADLVVAMIGLILSLPLMVIGALGIWLENGRPILYRQERVGEKGKTFTLYKLRTMKPDAEEESGPVWAATNRDPRVIRVGRFLRAARIDELPQLINVLKGEMSFVGPRPERPIFVEQLRALIPYYNERHSVKPGITGWAQIKFGYCSSTEEAEMKLRYDLYYIKHMHLILDFMILVDTAKVIIFGKGAR